MALTKQGQFILIYMYPAAYCRIDASQAFVPTNRRVIRVLRGTSFFLVPVVFSCGTLRFSGTTLEGLTASISVKQESSLDKGTEQ